jgi:hypothetical protein
MLPKWLYSCLDEFLPASLPSPQEGLNETEQLVHKLAPDVLAKIYLNRYRYLILFVFISFLLTGNSVLWTLYVDGTLGAKDLVNVFQLPTLFYCLLQIPKGRATYKGTLYILAFFLFLRLCLFGESATCWFNLPFAGFTLYIPMLSNDKVFASHAILSQAIKV